MPRLIKIEAVRTYATRENAIKAVEKKITASDCDHLRYFIHTSEDGRFFPVFIGTECMKFGIHFNFNLIG